MLIVFSQSKTDTTLTTSPYLSSKKAFAHKPCASFNHISEQETVNAK